MTKKMKIILGVVVAAGLVAGTISYKNASSASSPDVQEVEEAEKLNPVGPAFNADSALAYCAAQCDFGPRVKGNLANAGNYREGERKYYGRFNQGVVTVNLVDIGLSARKDMNRFWEIFDERMELCHRAMRCRHERLKGTLSDAAPILWQYGALARLKKGETIDKLLYDGYSTLSLGYAGLWECVYSLIEKKLTEPEGKKLGLEIMQKLNDYCAKWKEAENIDYSIYGTPLESTTYSFAKSLQRRFGIVKGVTDRNYITNSYHVHVTEPIDAFSKLKLESEFQALSPGGAISYVEVPIFRSL